jgi:hypothetical protein
MKAAICLALSFALVEVPFALNAHAGMISTGTAVSALVRSENRAKVQRFMQRHDVRAGFEKLGVNPDEAANRVSSMSDAEIQKISGAIDQNPAGGEPTIVIGLSTVLIVLLVLLLVGKI